MLKNINKTDLFYDYYAQWITVYKEGAIRKVTMDKYLLTLSWIKRLAPELKVCELSRITYQKLLNDYAKLHERQTTMDFHHQLKGAHAGDVAVSKAPRPALRDSGQDLRVASFLEMRKTF